MWRYILGFVGVAVWDDCKHSSVWLIAYIFISRHGVDFTVRQTWFYLRLSGALSSSSLWTHGAEVLGETPSPWQWGKRRWNVKFSHKGQIAWPWGWIHEQLRKHSSKETAEICWGISQHRIKWRRPNWAEGEADNQVTTEASEDPTGNSKARLPFSFNHVE